METGSENAIFGGPVSVAPTVFSGGVTRIFEIRLKIGENFFNFFRGALEGDKKKISRIAQCPLTYAHG